MAYPRVGHFFVLIFYILLIQPVLIPLFYNFLITELDRSKHIMFKGKLKAFAIHLALSIVIVSAIISTIIYFWYPVDYLDITSFKEIAVLIISIDLMLGPLLTFVVYKKNKKSLRFDLAVIAVIQFSALTYGSYYLFQAHPVYLTYAKGSFSLINAKLAKPENAKYSEYKVSKISSVNLAYSEIPTDPNEKNKLLNESFNGGPDLEERVDLYKPYDDHISEIIEESLDAEKIFSDPKTKNKTKRFLKKFGSNNLDKFVFLPLEGSTKNVVIVLDKKTAKPITTLAIDPWKLTKK